MGHSIITGLWYDYSKPRLLQATITLNVEDANYLLSALTFIVTIAGASFWNLTALALHHAKAHKHCPDDIDRQHRVVLRNGSISMSIMTLIKIFGAWRGTRPPKLLGRSLALLLPAIIVMVAFSAASILVSRVASNKTYSDTLARLRPLDCGLLFPGLGTDLDLTGQFVSKQFNDSQIARLYATEFYLGDRRSPGSQSVYPQVNLKYSTQKNAPCPFPNTTRCRPGPNTAFSVMSGQIDSTEMLGVNVPATDRVSFQTNLTCSPLDVRDLTRTNKTNNITRISIRMGPSLDDPATFETFGPETSIKSYSLKARFPGKGETLSVWQPISDFNRTDADVSAYFMVRHLVQYTRPVDDPWFSAHRRARGRVNLTEADRTVSVLGCAQQYTVCNDGATSRVCSAPNGLSQTLDAVLKLDLNPLQRQIAMIIGVNLVDAAPALAVSALNEQALYANGKMLGPTSPGLPNNQWQIEVLGWFQTMLAQLQHLTLQVVSKAGVTPGKGIAVGKPVFLRNGSWIYQNRQTQSESGLWDQYCVSQLVRTAGQVQNFSFLGVILVVTLTVFIVLLDASLETILDWLQMRFRGVPTRGMAARRADRNLQLLRESFGTGGNGEDGDDGWSDGFMGIPVRRLDHAGNELAEEAGNRGKHRYQAVSEEGLVASRDSLDMGDPNRGVAVY